MKKLAFALMLALPLMYASCSKDEEPKDEGDTTEVVNPNPDPEPDPEPEPDEITFALPALEWGKTIPVVKAAVAKDNKNVILYDESEEDLWYVTGTSINDDEWQLPWYMYYFNGNGLEDIEYYVDALYKTQLATWIGGIYHKYPRLEDEDWDTYGNTTEEKDCTLYVYVEDWSPADENGEVLYDFTVATWEPWTDDDAALVKTRGMSKREVAVKKHIATRKLRKSVK